MDRNRFGFNLELIKDSSGSLRIDWGVCLKFTLDADFLLFKLHEQVRDLTQVMMEKKEKAMAARAASAPWSSGTSSGVVRDH